MFEVLVYSKYVQQLAKSKMDQILKKKFGLKLIMPQLCTILFLNEVISWF